RRALPRLAQLRKQTDPAWAAAVLGRPARAHLLVLRGLRPGLLYPLWEGANYLGRAADRPADVDLAEQEPPDRIWASRQHALLTCAGGALTVEDLNTANGTYVNRFRVYPTQVRELSAGDVIQIGSVQLRVLL